MARARWYDWLGAFAAWSMACFIGGVFLSEGMGAPEEFVVTTFMLTWVGGVVAARVWWLRRPGGAPVGLTTGEAQLARLEEVEMRLAEMEVLQERVAELEERLDFSERLLASGAARQAQERADA